jgi:ERCC4-type nuclease
MIIIDKRETRSNVPKYLEQLGVPCCYATLEIGDYFVGDIPVERKESSDYVNSLVSGHLSEQLYNLSHNFELSFLIVEGSIANALMYSKITRAAYLSSLAGTAIKRAPDGKQGVINILSVDTEFDTALLLKYIHNKTNDYEPRLPRMEKFAPPYGDILVYILSSFPHIGEKRAKNLLSRFGSIDGLVGASLEQLQEVEDIGPVVAKSLYETLHRKVKL